MMKSKLLILFVILLSVPHAVQSQFLYQRKINPVTQEGWYTIPLPTSLLSTLKPGFEDLRIYSIKSSDTVEIPYLLKTYQDQTQIQEALLSPFNISRKDQNIFFTVSISPKNFINATILNFHQNNFQASVKVEGSQDQKNWFTMADSLTIVSMEEGPLHYTYNQIHFPLSQYPFLRFRIHSEQFLTLKEAKFSTTKLQKGIYQLSAHRFTQEETKSKESVMLTPKESPQLISKLVIRAEPGQMFYRNMNIEFLTDSMKTEKGWQFFYQTITRHVFNSFHEDTIEFSPRMITQFKITIQNEDNPSIKIKSIHSLAPVVKLTTYLKPGDYILCYGNTKSLAPDYDLGYFEKQITSIPTELNLKSEERVPSKNVEQTHPWFQNQQWLWVILIGVIAILGYYTLQMLRKA